MYHAIHDMFPQLANEPNYSSCTLWQQSPAFKNVWAFVVDMNGRKHRDQAHLNPLERLIQSSMKTGCGLCFIAWMETACHFGPWFHSFLLTMASENVHCGEEGRWMIGYHYVKNNTLMGMSLRAVLQHVSNAINAFVQVWDMVAWENPNNFFCMTRVEALDGDFYDHTDDINYPVCYFSMECTRSYWATSHCGNLVLNRVPEEVAKSRMNAAGGWSFKGRSMLPYLDSHIIGLCVERANNLGLGFGFGFCGMSKPLRRKEKWLQGFSWVRGLTEHGMEKREPRTGNREGSRLGPKPMGRGRGKWKRNRTMWEQERGDGDGTWYEEVAIAKWHVDLGLVVERRGVPGADTAFVIELNKYWTILYNILTIIVQLLNKNIFVSVDFWFFVYLTFYCKKILQ